MSYQVMSYEMTKNCHNYYYVQHPLQKYSLTMLSMSGEDIESVSDYSSLSGKQRNAFQLNKGLSIDRGIHCSGQCDTS